MKRLLKAAAALLCVFGLPFAQAQLTTITASSISMGGVAIAAGTVTFTPVNSSGIAIAFATGGGGLNSPTAFSCTITAGAIAEGCQIPDAALTTPANILYSVQITNTSTQKTFTLQQVANITGSTWPLDHYGPPAQTSNIQPVQSAYGSAAPPASCVNGSFYTRNNSGGELYTCVGGTFVLMTGTTLSIGTTAGTAAEGNDTRFATNASAAAAAQTIASAALPKSGGTMTGDLVLKGDPTASLQAATKSYVDEHGGSYTLPEATTSVLGGVKPDGTSITAVAGVISAVTATGTGTPQGIATTAGASYVQILTDGSTQTWIGSANGAVWTNQTTKQVVYAGTAALIGVTNAYEMNEGTGTVLTDSVGSTNLTLGGGAGGSPAWNSTNGLTYNNTNNQYVTVPQSFWVQHSTYMVCMTVTSLAAGVAPILGQAGSPGFPGIQTDNYGSPNISDGGIPSVTSSLQTLTLNSPACWTFVYNGAGSDQIWLGSVKLTLKTSGNTLMAATGPLGLGGFYHGLTGTIYKFSASVGTELPADIIQHNALVESARVAAATSLAVPTTPTNYQAGLPIQWCIGDSITAGNGFLPNTYCYSLPAQVKVPGLTVFNGGTNAQLIANYLSTGIFAQASNFLAQYTVPGNPPPPHYAGFYMGTNDITAGNTGATVYANWKSSMIPLYQAGWTTIAVSLTPVGNYSASQNTQRLAFNSALASGGYWSGFVDWADDLRMGNPAYPQYNGASPSFGVFSPYYYDTVALHPSAIGGAALAGRYESKMLDLGQIGKGYNYTPAYAQYMDIDRANGPNQTLTLTGNVSTLKVINGNQGDSVNLTICQDATGGRTVPAVAVGSGATATVTSSGVITLTAGGSGYDSNYLPVFYVSGLTCSTYPRYTATITAGAVASIAQTIAGVGCSGTGTVTVVSTEPVWNNFNTSAVNALAAGKCLKQSFTYDGLGQSIN